jgi:hypothetical protein
MSRKRKNLAPRPPAPPQITLRALTPNEEAMKLHDKLSIEIPVNTITEILRDLVRWHPHVRERLDKPGRERRPDPFVTLTYNVTTGPGEAVEFTGVTAEMTIT